MEQVAELAGTYRKEFEETFENLRQRGAGLSEESQKLIQEAQSQLEPSKQELVNTITDTSDVSTPVKPVVEVFGWSTVLLLGSAVGSVLGAYFLGPFIGLLVGKFGAALFGFVALPVYGHYLIKKAETENIADSTVRFQLLALAAGQGVLAGFVLSNSFLTAQPLALLTPLVIAAAFPTIAKSVGASRISLLSASLSAAFGINFVLGLLSGYLTGHYLFLSLLYTAAAGVVLQLVFKNVQTPEQRTHLYQLALLTTFVLAKAVVAGVFGYSYAAPVIRSQPQHAQ